jgi:hypothetical protein
MMLRDALRHQLRWHIYGRMPWSEEGNDLVTGASVSNLRQRTHPLDDLQGWAEKINGVSATAETKLFCPLHDSRLKTEPGKPVREHRPGHAGT